MVHQKTDKQQRWERKQSKFMRFFEAERSGEENKETNKPLPPYAYTPLCPDPKYRTASVKKKEEK